ncbi:hypothetical protein ACOMHN_009901 [Nucella lapillus]
MSFAGKESDTGHPLRHHEHMETTFGTGGSFSPVTATVHMEEADSVFTPRTASFSHLETTDSGVSSMKSLQVARSPSHQRSGSSLSTNSLFLEEEKEASILPTF